MAMYENEDNNGTPPSVGPSGSAHLPTITTREELIAYLHAELDVPVGGNDPILILHLMNRLFLADYDRMLEQHNTAITTVMGNAIKGLTEEALSENLKEQVRLADRTHQLFERQYKRALFLSGFNLLTFFICLLVLAFLILK